VILTSTYNQVVDIPTHSGRFLDLLLNFFSLCVPDNLLGFLEDPLDFRDVLTGQLVGIGVQVR